MDGSIGRIYRSIALTWAIAVTWACAFQKPWIALSLTIGTLMGTAILASNSWIFPRILRQGVANPTRKLAKIWLLKYPVMAGALYLVLRLDGISVLALCGGVVLVHLAIVLRTLGAMMVNRS